MQSAQESLAELRAAIRYCENAISAAESTIESIDFRQQLAKQQAMNKQESTGREVALEARVKELEAQLDKATMPVIPRDVAIAIFREGQRHGYNNKSVAENLKGLCADKGFECRIHGIDDQETNK